MNRHRQPEWMDDQHVDPARLERSLIFIERINRCLGYTRSTVFHLARFARHWIPAEPVRILDLATGSADVPRAILRFADRAGHNIRITAVDLHAHTIDFARRRTDDPRIDLIRADVFDLPFPPASFDYVVTSMFLHHLDEDQIVRLLRIMDQQSRRGIIAADLLRHRRAYAWITLFTLFSDPMIRHDARASVAQALTRDEVIALRDQAGLQWAKYYRHNAHRFVLAGEKNRR
jgi:2-polyprenyl-3-methyl-5-hydroxy-6-metoxy-1,4-benzoquinol methylase